MTYTLIGDKATVLSENLTLGQAFTCIDNWCYDNKAHYSLADLKNDEVGSCMTIEVFIGSGPYEFVLFTIVEEDKTK